MDTLQVTGRIFDIQRFSVHDGPGVRTIVFLKGCALRCRWCCNPESQEYAIQQMVQDGKAKTVGRDVTVAEVLEQVKRDMPYYRRSGGGVTLSGGECLCQPDFTYALLKTFQENSLTTAIESTACASYDVIERILPYLDVYLMDIKHMDPQKHKAFTSRSNELMLENAKKIARTARRLIIRVPVIPGFNDTEAEIGDIAAFTKSLKTVEEIHLLPYHSYGSGKYAALGREYTLKDIKPPEAALMERLRSVVEQTGLRCQIGG